MKVQKNREIIFHKIKVNKKERNNRFNNSQNNFNIRNNNDCSSNASSPDNSNIMFHYKNYDKVPYIIIKNYKPNSNSVEKQLKNNNNNYYIYNREKNNLIDPKLRYTQSIINHENSDGNILFFDNLNNNINNKRNKRKICRKILNSNNLENNKNNNLSIKTTYLNNYNNNNSMNIDENFKTIGNNKINNYINEFNLINNYYENNYKNNFNRQTYNILNRSLDNKRQNYFINKNPNNKNNQKYIINKINNNNYNNKIQLRNRNTINNNINKFDLNNYNNDYENTKKKNKYNRFQNNNIYIKCKSPLRRNEYLIEYNNNYKENNYKKLFSIYRGKLIQEFMRHFKRTINLFLLRELNNIKNFIDNKNYRNKNNFIFIPKRRKNDSNHNNIKKINNLSKIDKNYYADEEIKKSNKLMNKKYIKLFYSEKKNPIEANLKQVLTSRNDLNIKQKNINKIIKENINNHIIPEDSNNLIFSNRLIKCIEKEPITKLNYSHTREIKRTTNFSIDKNNNNNNNNNFIYKKKIKLNEKNALNIKKENKIKGRIIDIDINLGKSLKEISDMSLIRNFEMNNKNKKNNKHKKRAKTRRKYSLPKKKYLEEEEYDNEHNLSFPYKTYSYDNKKHKKNNLININRDMEKNKEKFLEDIIITNDKLLSIRIKNLFSIKYNNINKEYKYYNNILQINKIENFSINFDIVKYKHNSFYSLTELIKLRNINNLSFEQNKKDKYLLSCVKFIIRAINKIFLKRKYTRFKKCIYLNKQ